ncbi:ribosome-associated ATPase/putative transporter RbbA [Bradyrhizobium sp. LMTR 3]|uniref:ribosome-associated ATPase/putative transporter RbbA n=1 Tax=Bradyrhizobium sp. LMTR 3 TaxID=189873 RepID=UPI000810AB15|nr:ribosome-associated ATPase/putative transporter RbbA [Bradyrhizobium sp. LMTR 3]OCK53804.1 multidrug ABC transporter ATP-binding protein [Bradyrhizobium sp. LMTR 3]
MNDHTQPVARALAITHIYKKVRALDDVSVDIPSGQMVGLLGPDGVGKSTLLGLLAGARKLQRGSLHVLGGDIASADHRKVVGPRIAFMPQGLGKNLYQELSIEENLDFFGRLFGQARAERQVRIDRLTRATGLHAFLDRPAGKLSGGMKQKLGLCCALIHDPDLLILDEPTTGIDPLSRRQFWQLIGAIRAERPGMSVIVSTAYMEEAEQFDWLIAMTAGRILASGSLQDLKRKADTDNFETAFVRLLPGEQHRGKGELIIPPLEQPKGKPAIVARGLTRRFGDFTAVDHVSFGIEEGEIFGFLGSNGCGKTTTMKMLTGLLPATEGEALLFGNPVDARDQQTRKRVGFMSQSFSLYDELTVAENLKLHARLFHLPPEKADQRITSLIDRFGLRAHSDAKASSLPLGMRQRLSLAVAIVHEPEMLILDEPTSGVDPVARDAFWELLVELSRKDKVTVFISTHFMNEAMRCDRISLMHAGKVLINDAPRRIIASKNAQTLDQAFIAYIEDAIGETAQADSIASLAAADGSPRDIRGTPSPKQTRWGFSPARMFAYSYRELIEVMRDPVRLAFAFLGSVILIIIMAYGITQDVENLTYAALDLDQTPQSRAYLRNFSGSRYFTERTEIRSGDELESRLKSNDITLAIEIPVGFGRDLKRFGKLQVSTWIDGANTVRAGTIEGYVAGAHAQFLSTFARESGINASSAASGSVEPRYRYNPSFESIYGMGPSVPALLLLLFPAILAAVSVAREKEIGTITNFYVTPTSRFEFLIGKQLPYVLIGMVNFIILTLLVVFLMQVPLKGSLLGLSIGALFYLFASTGYGLLISSVTKSQVAAVFAGAILSMLPTMQFSGMLQPVSTLEGGAWLMGTLWPTTYYMHLSVGAFTKGLAIGDLATDLLVLAAFIPVFVLAAAAFLKKQDA